VPGFGCRSELKAIAAVLAALALGLVAIATPASGSPARAPLLGVLWTLPGGPRLAKLDPMTLAPVGDKRLVVGGTQLLARSPDRSRIALAGGSIAAVRILDATELRRLGVVRLGSGHVVAGVWPERGRLLVLIGTKTSEIVVIDPQALRVLKRRPLGGFVLQSAAAAGRMVALLGRYGAILPLRLAVIERDGSARTVALPGIRGGWSLPTRTNDAFQARPGLAVDPSGRRAVVVAGDGTIAEVDLARMRLRLHRAAARTISKSVRGWSRRAIWFSPSVLAITGWNQDGASKPVGLSFRDTGTWRATRPDPLATDAVKAGEVLLAFGSHFDAETQKTVGAGLSGYGLRGRLRFHVLGEEPIADVQIARGLAYVGSCTRTCFRVVDVGTGRVVGETRSAVPTSLLG
jgi:hypothetical protein